MSVCDPSALAVRPALPCVASDTPGALRGLCQSVTFARTLDLGGQSRGQLRNRRRSCTLTGVQCQTRQCVTIARSLDNTHHARTLRLCGGGLGNMGRGAPPGGNGPLAPPAAPREVPGDRVAPRCQGGSLRPPCGPPAAPGRRERPTRGVVPLIPTRPVDVGVPWSDVSANAGSGSPSISLDLWVRL